MSISIWEGNKAQDLIDAVSQSKNDWDSGNVLRLINAISQIGVIGISDYAKMCLLNCFQHVAWVDDNGQQAYNKLEAALFNISDTDTNIIEKNVSNNDFNLVPYYTFNSAENWSQTSLYPSLLIARSGNNSCMIYSSSGEEPMYKYQAQNAQSPIATSYYPIPIPDGFNRYTISVPSGYVLWAYHFTYDSQNKTYINHTSSGNWFQNYTKNIENNGNMFLTASIRKSDQTDFDENSLPSNVTIIFEKV